MLARGKAFLIVVLFTAASVSHADLANLNSTNTALKQSTAPTAQSDTESALLKQEVQMLKTFQDNILKVVIYSLSTVGTLALVLVGYNWWNAHKMYERDKSALKDEVLNAQKQAQINFENSVGRQLSGTVTTINERVQQFETSVSEKTSRSLASVEEKYLRYSENISEKLNDKLRSTEEKFLNFRDETGKSLQSFRAELDQQLRAHTKASVSDLALQLNQKIDALKNIHETRFNGLETDVNRVKYELYTGLAETLEAAGKWSMAYTQRFKALTAAVSMGLDICILLAMSGASDCIQKGGAVTKHEKEEARSLSPKIPEKFRKEIDEFLSLVSKAQEI